MSLLTLDEARQTLKIDDSDTSVNAELQHYVDAIGTAIENHLNEVIDPRAVTERLRLVGNTRFVLKKVPVIELTSITDLHGVTYDVTGMDVDPDTGVVEVFKGPVPCGTVIVAYQAGWETAPENYKRAAAITIQHIWESQRGVGNVFGGVIGEEERLNRLWMYGLPRKALEWLGDPAPSV